MPRPPIAKDTMTLAQAARYLHLGEDTVLELASSERLPSEKHGESWVFDRASLDAWLERQRAAGVAFDDVTDGTDVPLGELLTTESFVLDLRAEDALGVIEEVAARAYTQGWLKNKPWFIGALVERESLASTALEGGVAFLHTREQDNGKIHQPFIILGRSHQGVDYGAPDGKPTYLFFLLGLKYDKLHLPILGRLARVLKNPVTVAKLRATTSVSKIRSLLLQEDEKARSGRLSAFAVAFPQSAELSREIRKRAIMRVAMRKREQEKKARTKALTKRAPAKPAAVAKTAPANGHNGTKKAAAKPAARKRTTKQRD
jgi:excisionase family DNA binding protein